MELCSASHHSLRPMMNIIKTEGIAFRQPRNSVPRLNLTLRRHGVLFTRHYSDLSGRDTAIDSRVRLSRIWIPTGGIAEGSLEDAHSKLIRAGFLRQAHSGIFHMLPLGLRVQDKLEKLIDKHMSKLGASKLALSSISSEELWTRSGRLRGAGSELFHFQDRKSAAYLLSPTHEEEITSLVASTVKSYKELPVRLYQTSRKYRDELRPRHGVLRSREFVMKDLYTFDYSTSKALETYHQVREVYEELFNELKIPYLVAEADSGDMGGNLSHEFHFPTLKGEDHVISCTSCNYVANEELAESVVLPKDLGVPVPSAQNLPQSNLNELPEQAIKVWRGVSRDRRTLVNAWYISSTTPHTANHPEPEINTHAIKAIVPDLDASVEDPLSFWPKASRADVPSSDGGLLKSMSTRLVNLIDCRLPDSFRLAIEAGSSKIQIWPAAISETCQEIMTSIVDHHSITGQPLNLLRIKDGDSCSRCTNGILKVQKAIELGHTFYLGNRYSEPLQAMVTVPVEHLDEDEVVGNRSNKTGLGHSEAVAMQMGCHGIGVSRMIGAVADTLADERGLNWPRVMAPFEVVVVPVKGLDDGALEVYDSLCARSLPVKDGEIPPDLVVDDRSASFPWKMRDADLVGYPVIVVVGRRWQAEQVCEVQCRRLQICEEVPLQDLAVFIQSILVRL